ncbi:Uncharacterised protein [Yersinia nurmii]|uniref:Uncharacterized protein n=1 Tax=Yersinia nurmii TaxID=685706 RepID=A0ABM9S131_9GAMM|nr:Uncharacterised protein [Yersinia nurmii]
MKFNVNYMGTSEYQCKASHYAACSIKYCSKNDRFYAKSVKKPAHFCFFFRRFITSHL